MSRKSFSSVTDQVTQRLREGMMEGRWKETLPGRDRLALDLGCSHWTVEEAMRRLAKEGLLESLGSGRRRRIVKPAGKSQRRPLKVTILLYEPSDRKTGYLIELVHELKNAGHEAGFAAKTMRCLGMSVSRIARFVSAMESDAWVVLAGSRDVLEWFGGQPLPVFALFGRYRSAPVAGMGIDKMPAYAEVVDRLVRLGHRRIVNVVREDRRKPAPSALDRFFLEQLRKHGIATGSYNLPNWRDTPSGLQKLLDSLFRHTPPTALLLDEPLLFVAARDNLAMKGIIAPRDVSLVCCDHDEILDWCVPAITHIQWNPRPLVRRMVRWADQVSRGKDDRRKSVTDAKWFLGGTIGPVPGS